jgi:hypothetical protein
MPSLSNFIGLLFLTISTRITAVKFKLPVLFCKLLSKSKLPSTSPAAVPKSLCSDVLPNFLPLLSVKKSLKLASFLCCKLIKYSSPVLIHN